MVIDVAIVVVVVVVVVVVRVIETTSTIILKLAMRSYFHIRRR